MQIMYQKCRLVHADLSEYNLLYHMGKLVIIDVSQSVDLDHPRALVFLREDCTHGTVTVQSQCSRRKRVVQSQCSHRTVAAQSQCSPVQSRCSCSAVAEQSRCSRSTIADDKRDGAPLTLRLGRALRGNAVSVNLLGENQILQ